jgi:hypothetical protein
MNRRRRYLGLDVLARCRIRPITDTDYTTAEEVTTQRSARDRHEDHAVAVTRHASGRDSVQAGSDDSC